MAKIDRRIFRDRMKKEFKKFVKENQAYKHMTFSQFSELVKVNMLKIKKQNVAASSVLDDHAGHDHSHSHDHELQDMFTEVVEESSETTVTE